jgi:hypothetical protein
MDASRLIDDFLSAHTAGGELSEHDPRNESVWELNRLAQEEPDTAWLLILEILARTTDDHVMGNLAAGPLEDLITYHGAAVIERVELESRRNPRFRKLLGGVWRNDTPPEIWSRVEAAQGETW